MRLLIITQKVDKNDPILGFFHNWILKISERVEEVIVICLEKGKYDLPENVSVLSLGKEDRVSKGVIVLNFYKYILKNRNRYDSVFVHMNPVYVVLGGLLWKLFSKKIYLWYTHKNVDTKLRIAEKLVHNIFTASEKSFRLKSNKLIVVGHGIDTTFFKPYKDSVPRSGFITVGRISLIKRIDLMIKVIAYLRDKKYEERLTIIGDPSSKEDEKYLNYLKSIVEDKSLEKNVIFNGSVSNSDVLNFYREAKLFLNFSNTGSLDKAVLEAMSTGCNVITNNEAFSGWNNIYTPLEDPQKIADFISNKPFGTGLKNRDYIVKNHDLEKLLDRLIINLNK